MLYEIRHNTNLQNECFKEKHEIKVFQGSTDTDATNCKYLFTCKKLDMWQLATIERICAIDPT